jgi:hypothetical protein
MDYIKNSEPLFQQPDSFCGWGGKRVEKMLGAVDGLAG